MPSYLQIENISKSYGPKVLFENIGFNINEGDKIALIAPNGTGKTSLMRILAGEDKSDSGGKILFLKDIRISFLEQDPPYDPEESIAEHIGDEGGDYLLRARKHLTSLGLADLSRRMGTLSGGELKRVAISRMLASEADFYIMDEPTNHLDIDAIEYLENVLGHSRCTLLMVTHDRYFLDRVCNTVMELDRGNVYIYKGDYENYLEKRQERIENYNANTEKVRNLLRRELEWIHATPCARSGKAKYRKEAFKVLQERASQGYVSSSVSLDSLTGTTRLGTKIINCKNLSFGYGDKVLLKDFSYNFARYERIGIVGPNGVGKSSFIKLLTGEAEGGWQTGAIERGESLRIGHYNQDGMSFDEDQTVLETVGDTHLLGEFLFTHDMFNNRVGSLSGGERRRLYLLTILIKQPNLLILDEPTNDLDIITLNVLEEYLLSWQGTLLIVSHDRHFLDRLTDHLLVFTGDGAVKDFVGHFSEYREYIKSVSKAKASEKPARSAAPSSEEGQAQRRPAANKLSYKEKKELEALESDILSLNLEKVELEKKLSGGALTYEEASEVSQRYSALKDELDEKELRWLELSDR